MGHIETAQKVLEDEMKLLASEENDVQVSQ